MSQLPEYLSITNQPSKALEQLIHQWNPDKIAILVDENTKANCLAHFQAINHELIEIPSGEENKTLHTCEKIWESLTEFQFSRKSLLVNLGGGVIGDMGGFVASTYKRGIKFINVPTTLLSQVDASIGGKLGVDFGHFKNHIGLFRNPDHVIVNPNFLSTLSDRELRSGFAEVIKHALISDVNHWNQLKTLGFNEQDWNQVIPKSIGIKNQVVLSDPLEHGKRKILNFGHTLGHAFESYFLNSQSKLLHGEAIAIGMILESHLSFQKEWIAKEDFNGIRKFISETFKFSNEVPSIENLNEYLLHDKKNDSSGINFSLLKGIGNCEFDVRVGNEMIKKSLAAYRGN